jgi:hypothetical protein
MSTKQGKLGDQSGTALVVALVMMIVLTLIGLASSFTSTFEVKLSGNKRGSTDAFFAADGGVQVIMSSVPNFDLPGKYDESGKYDYTNFTDGEGHKNFNPTNANIVVSQLANESGAPRGMGMSATGAGGEFVHFLIESTGRDQMDLSPFRSTCTIQEKVIRLVPGT